MFDTLKLTPIDFTATVGYIGESKKITIPITWRNVRWWLFKLAPVCSIGYIREMALAYQMELLIELYDIAVSDDNLVYIRYPQATYTREQMEGFKKVTLALQSESVSIPRLNFWNHAVVDVRFRNYPDDRSMAWIDFWSVVNFKRQLSRITPKGWVDPPDRRIGGRVISL